MKKLISIVLSLVLTLCISSALAISPDISVSAQCHVGNFGREPLTFTLEGVSEEDAALVEAEDFIISGDFVNPANCAEGTDDVTAVEYKDGKLILSVGGFRYNPSNFVVTYTGPAKANLSFTKADVASVETAIADDFEYCQIDDMFYRLYIPEDAEGPLPLIVWHHGGGSRGTGNEAQIVNLLGATPYIERYKDVVVLAPQTQLDTEAGINQDWTDLVDSIRTVILGLIEDGTVDASRIYGTGCSFGGHGVIVDAAYNHDLYAAINVQCPLLVGRTIADFLSLTDVAIYLTAAESDGTLPYAASMGATICDYLKASGLNDNVQYHIYTDEEMNAYGIGTTEGLTAAQIGAEMHNSWVLAFNNEQGVMDWLMAQSK